MSFALKNTSSRHSCHVNDVHSQLNPTRVAEVRTIRSVADAEQLLAEANAGGYRLVPVGGRGAMGGQQVAKDALLFDMRGYREVIAFDKRQGFVTVGAGINWTELYEWLGENSPGAGWTFRQKQTGADFLTVGGAVSANAHGRGLRMKPFVDDVESLRILTPQGDLVVADRVHHADLFRLVCGGYGMFGLILEVTLRLKRREVVQRTVVEITSDRLMAAFEERIAQGYSYGDFQFEIDPQSDGFLKRGLFSCYRPVADRPLPQNRKFLTPEEWDGLLKLAHTDKAQAYRSYREHYMASDGQVYHCDEQQMSYYLGYYHEQIDRELGCKGSEMITELYVPRDRLEPFLAEVRQWLRKMDADVIYGTIRLIERDDEAALTWAREGFVCLILNLHIDHTAFGLQKNQAIFTGLIDLALAQRGSFYLTYHRWVRADQLRQAYPIIDHVFREKLVRDPEGRFASTWYQAIRKCLANSD